ncbi:penicillin-binding protein PBP2A [Streptococcus merionis]|uniref:Penicillin-binding protein 2A n=1 Tax=Streptococcus merionis TaxID=400065 RepID=A0A239T216_9STRE|nr:penicillin-binding protein PBP2A [Streptococcus merionis]SNU91138.1 penicillin-binding protein 2A [Streptococcus merionis]
MNPKQFFENFMRKYFLPDETEREGEDVEAVAEDLTFDQGPVSDAPESYQTEATSKSSRRRRFGKAKEPKKGQSAFRRFWRRYHLTKILLILMATAAVVTGGWLFFLAKTANVKDLQAALQAETIIYDKDAVEAGSLSGQKGTYVQLDAISDYMEQAVIATEDRTFYENSGINFGRFALAILTLGRAGGGSTITQQLAKNAYLTQEQTVTRKAKEFFLALELTKAYEKDEILAMYLNNAYFGNGVWGVEDASLKYFGISASQLTLSQAATLAGMLKGPEVYNPYYSLENATNRRNTVIQVMVDAGYIDQATADESADVDMNGQLNDAYAGRSSKYAYPSYFDAVIEEATTKYGLKESDIVNNGLRIYTELDQTYQANIQAVYNEDSLFPVAYSDGELAQSASVALDPSTGGVRALVGRVNSSENYTYRSFNYATQSERSPGSTIKPLVVYTPAIAAGWATDRELDNTTTTYGAYTLDNYMSSRTETGTVPMYQALAQSLNIPAVATVNELGIDTAFSYGKKFGLNMSKVPQELGVALGGGVVTNPLQMAQAYSAFANNGVRADAHLITRIETANGKVLKTHKSKKTRVMDSAVANKMTSMMLGTFSNGTGVYAAPYGYTMAGKTGTTETNFDPNVASDQWVIGYTPDVVITHWLGFSKTDENHYLEGSSSNQASTIFKTVANSILPYTAGTEFTQENTYAENGIAPVNEAGQTTDTASEILETVKEQAEQIMDQTKKAIEEANIPEKVLDLWETIKSLFQ